VARHISTLKNFSWVNKKSAHLNENGENSPGLAFEENLYSMAEEVMKVLSFFVLMTIKGMHAVSSDK
jgi:Fanconi anemia group I protein